MAQPLAVYPYHDRNGHVVRQKLRLPGKQFMWQFPVEGGWVNGYGDEPPLLYQLRSVLRATNRKRVVHVCEGEKDADALRDRGHTATTPPQNEPWPSGLAEPLRGARVRLYWDADGDGHKRAHWALRALRAVGAAVTCWRAAKGNDVYDHLEAGLGVADFIEEEPPAVKPGQLKTYTQTDQEAVARLVDEAGPAADWVEAVLSKYADTVHDHDAVLMTDDDILGLPAPEWLIEGFVPAVGMTAVWGVPGVGKSTLGDDWQDQVRRGGAWNGYPVKQGSVFSLAGEGAQQYRNRIEALRHARGGMNGGCPRLLTQENWDITTMDGLARVVRACWAVAQTAPLVLVEVDPIGLYGTRNRDGVEDTELLAKATRALGLGLGCAVVVFQHANALAQRGRGTDHLRMYSETYCRLEAMGSRDVAFTHDGKNRQGELRAMRFERISAGPGPVLMPVRGELGDEYTPDDVAREQNERREEAKEEAKAHKAVEHATDPLMRNTVLGALPVEQDNAVSGRAVADLTGLDRKKMGPVLFALQTEGLITCRRGPRNSDLWWKLA